jgi:hypothetical protein
LGNQVNKRLAKINLGSVIGSIPYRMAFAGGWVDQPFISAHNPSPPGSMVVVSLEPTFPFMTKCGMGTSSRQVAMEIWDGSLPDKDPQLLMRELYHAENGDRNEPSGSQDMAGIVFSGVNRLDFDVNFEGGFFPVHVESNNDPKIARWLEDVIYCLPINQRPSGYFPLGEINLDPVWIEKLGQTGKDCFQAILNQNAEKLGSSMNETMRCWETILPHTVRHPTITINLLEILKYYQSCYKGAMYSGCGGGYLYVVSDEPVPGAFKVNIRISAGKKDQNG